MNRALATALVVLAGLGAAALACGSKHVSSADYDRTCAIDDNCALATFGDVCEPACNPNGAVNVKDIDRLITDRATKARQCPEVSYVEDPCAGNRKSYKPRCSAGTCTFVEVPPDAGRDAGDAGDAG